MYRRIGPDPEDRVPDAPCIVHDEPNPWCPVCRIARDEIGTQRTYRAISEARIRALVQPLADEYATPEGFAKACGWKVAGEVE